MIIGLIGPVSCLGGIGLTAMAWQAVSFRASIIGLVVPTALSAAGLLLGAFAFFMIAYRPQILRGTGYAGVGLALNIVGIAVNILIASTLVELGTLVSSTSLYALRTIDSGESDKIDAVFHESVRSQLTEERLEGFRNEVQDALGPPSEGKPVRSLVEMFAIRWPIAGKAVRNGKRENDLPAVPLRFERANVLLVLNLHEDVVSQLFSLNMSLEALVTDIWLITEDGQQIRLMDP